MTRIRLTLTLLAAALCGCATPPKPTRQISDIPPGSFAVDWAADLTGTPQNLYLVGGLLFVYDQDNNVAAYDTHGSLKFKTHVGEPGDIVGLPVVQPDRVIFPTSGSLELYTPGGVKTKTITLSQPVRSPGVAQDNILYVGSDSETGGRLAAIALDRNYNFYQWTVLTGIVHTQPVIHDNVVYCATEDGRVYAITIDRNPAWSQGPEIPDGVFHADGNIVAPIKFDDTASKADEAGLYVPSTDTKLYCLNPFDGHVRWQYYAGIPLVNSPAITADTVYERVESKGLVALPKKTGERIVTPKWTFAQGAQLLASDNKNAYVLTADGSAVALNKSDGSVLFRSKGHDLSRAVTNPDAKEPLLFALTKDKRLVCLRPILRSGVVGELAMSGD